MASSSIYKKARSAVDAWQQRDLTLQAIEEQKQQLRLLFHETDFRAMREKAHARQDVDRLLSKYGFEKESKFEEAFEKQQQDKEEQQRAKNHPAPTDQHEPEEVREATRSESQQNNTTGTKKATSSNITDADYQTYERLLSHATYGTAMSEKVLALCADWEILKGKIETLLCVEEIRDGGDIMPMEVGRDHSTSSEGNIKIAGAGASSTRIVNGDEEQAEKALHLLRQELRTYILESEQDPEVAKQREREQQRQKRQKLAEEEENKRARAEIQTATERQQALELQRREKELAEEKEKRDKANELLRLAEEAALYDKAQMMEREQNWVLLADADKQRSKGTSSRQLLNESFSELLRSNSLQSFKQDRLPALRKLTEALAKRPEEHPNVLRLDNKDFQNDFGNCLPARKVLFGLGYRRVEEESIHSNGVDFPKSKGPYYFVAEPDPLEDFDKYAEFTEFFESLLNRLNEVANMVHGFSSQANNDRCAAELFGADFLLVP
ncbi:unnamed protein product [Amoebophrya sp. A120]|nr:unnamed protein product [Amoebophrya sp. A120]|eukprot:GSA120T00014850001.1